MKSVAVGADTFPLDRISELSDDILVDILSTLEFREAARTSVLSRRWLNLWTLVPRLHFEITKYQRNWRTDRPVFLDWVSRVLGVHKSYYLREFRILFKLKFDNSYQNEIDKWVEYAFGRGVESLELNFAQPGFLDVTIEDGYTLTDRLLERFAPGFGFSTVRALCFCVVNISGEAIEFLLHRCPLLEDLRVIASKALVNLVVSGPSLLLKHLQISGCWRFEAITISDMNIVSLRVSTRDKGHLLLNNLPMLTDVWIDNGRFHNKSTLFSQFACCLSQLTNLTFQTYTMYPEANDIMQFDKFPELHNLRRLVFSTAYRVERSIIGLTSLIDSCPCLEEFALLLDPAVFTRVSMWNIEQKKARKQSLDGLRVFELYGYQGHNKNENELIMFFIKNTVSLEKIIIDPRDVTICHGSKPIESIRAKESRRIAIEKFEGVVPKHVQLVIL